EPPDAPAAPARPVRASALPRDERRAEIVRATAPLVRAHGRDVTTKQIAEAAGIAEGTIFRAFDSKEALLEAVIDHVLDVNDTIERIGAIDPTAPLAERVQQCATILRDRLGSVM